VFVSAEIIKLRKIVKKFPGVVANDGVDLSVRAGTIHAIIGENGSGKSTLMKILYGAQSPDSGQIFFNGGEVKFQSARDAINCGIGMVFQHFKLAANFRVWENVVLGSEPGTALRLTEAAAVNSIKELASRFGFVVNPYEITGDLGVGERQRVEILKVLYRGAKVVILDEPTAVLVPQEVDSLFESLRDLVENGVTVIFISHKLDEVLKVAQRVTVVRSGKTVAELDITPEVSSRELARLMIGSDLPQPEFVHGRKSDVKIFEMDGIEAEIDGVKVLRDVSLAVHSGEIVGVAGVEGNGQTELLEVALGLRKPKSGAVRFKGEDIGGWSVRQRRDAGIGYIPADRQHDALMLSASLWENVALGHQRSSPSSKKGLITREQLRIHTEAVIREFDVRTPSVDTISLALSGGNQQKLVVGREMLAHPQLLVAAHPTRGIDVGAQSAIWNSLRDAKRTGKGLLLISADLDELIKLSDVLLVLYRSSIVARLDPSAVTPEILGSYMTGAVSA
jgi:simple sugar transport system ATP-binding protein